MKKEASKFLISVDNIRIKIIMELLINHLKLYYKKIKLTLY